jgi:siroheme decarboxylase
MLMRAAETTIDLDDLDRKIINHLQEGFPLVPNPFARAAIQIGCAEQDLIDRVTKLREQGIITRFGPFIDAAALGGAFCLCAMNVPSERFDEVAEIVNGHPEVAHNYERVHAFNMWFVLATETAEEISATADLIERETGLAVALFPKLEEYFIGFKVVA